ncbi:MAG: tRNA pseudouridine(38-40) synthase TruA [bacterium]|nr:tRNA pseudouridine(38-40) synthase TruA [bacterium]
MKSGHKFRYRLDVQYDGTEFSGMQWQPDRRTVQKCIEDALEPLFGAKVRVIPSSRTDAGVHAARQVVHVDVPVQRNPGSIVRAGNVELPHDARIVYAEKVDDNFYARFSARWCGYRYRIAQAPVAIGRQYVWQFFQPLDRECLFELADDVAGTHRFTAFAHENPTEKHNYESTVFRSCWEEDGELLVYCIEASRFVHGMVRMIVGTMVDIATGRGSVNSLREVLLSGDNRNAGTKAPATGLTLETVGYQDWPNA